MSLTETHCLSTNSGATADAFAALHDRAERDRLGLFLADGLRPIAAACHFHASIVAIAVCPDLLPRPVGLVDNLLRSGLPVTSITPEEYRRISTLAEPQGILAIIRQRWLALDRAKLDRKLCWLAIDSLRSPGNLGSILRTASAAGVAGVFFLDDTVDPYHPASVRASMGGLFSLRFVRTTAERLVAWKERHRWQLVGATPNGSIDFRAARYDQPTILLLGDERRGLSPALAGSCDTLVRIPMTGRTDSLNVATAGAVLLYEIARQRSLTIQR